MKDISIRLASPAFSKSLRHVDIPPIGNQPSAAANAAEQEKRTFDFDVNRSAITDSVIDIAESSFIVKFKIKKRADEAAPTAAENLSVVDGAESLFKTFRLDHEGQQIYFLENFADAIHLQKTLEWTDERAKSVGRMDMTFFDGPG